MVLHFSDVGLEISFCLILDLLAIQQENPKIKHFSLDQDFGDFMDEESFTTMGLSIDINISAHIEIILIQDIAALDEAHSGRPVFRDHLM